MGKTADVQQAIWADPWFQALPPDAKLLYLWAITTDHGNLASLFTVALPMIQVETGLTPQRLSNALDQLDGKLAYRRESGALWVVGRAKRVRSKTAQIAKSIAKAVSECPEPEFQAAFMAKYGTSQWLSPFLSDLALQADSSEPHPNLTRTSPEVPSQSQSQVVASVFEEQNGNIPKRSEEWQEWLEHYRATTGRVGVQGSKPARDAFAARRAEGRSLADLKQATVGCHGNTYNREHGHDVPETILRASKVERYIELAKQGPADEHPADKRMREMREIAEAA